MAAEGYSASFRKPAEAYDRFVGRYGRDLGRAFVEWVGLEHTARVLDVGCGPGALTEVLAETVGAARVAAVDPSEPFADACSERVAGADVRVASADGLPFEEDTFDATLSQLVMNFLPDAAAGTQEMRRVTRPGGTIAAAVWDYAGEMTMLRTFWDAAVALDPAAESQDEGRRMRFSDPATLTRLLTEADLDDVETGAVVVSARYDDFADLWWPFTQGVGPAGAYCASLDQTRQDALKAEVQARLGAPAGPFELSARAWLARGTVRSSA